MSAQRTATIQAAVGQHLLDAGLVTAGRENDAPGSGLGHRLEDIGGAVDIDVVVSATHPRTMRDHIRTCHSTFDGGGIPDIGRNEIR